MEQLKKQNEQQFLLLLEALNKPATEKSLLMVKCPQPSSALAVIEQLEGELEETQQIVLDWQIKQINSFKEYLEVSNILEALAQSHPHIIHILGLENSLLEEIVEDENAIMATWNEDVETLKNLAPQIVIWTDNHTRNRIIEEAPEIGNLITQEFEFKVLSDIASKEPDDTQTSQLEEWEKAEDWLQIGQMWMELKHYDKAQEYAQKALETSEEDSLDSVKAHLLMGRIHDNQEEWQKALSSYNTAYNLVDESEEKTIAELAFRIANIFATHERPDTALAWYADVIATEADIDPTIRAKSHRNIGMLHAQAGDIDTSFEHLEQALDGLEEAEAWDSLAYTHQQIANIFVNIQQIGDAIEHHQSAADYFTKIEDYEAVGNNYERMARLSQYKGRMPAVISYYEQAIAAFKKIGNHKVLASVHQKLGAVHQDQLNWAGALKHYEHALPYAQQLEDEFLVESLTDSIENMQAKASTPEKKKGKGLFGGLFGKK